VIRIVSSNYYDSLHQLMYQEKDAELPRKWKIRGRRLSSAFEQKKIDSRSSQTLNSMDNDPQACASGSAQTSSTNDSEGIEYLEEIQKSQRASSREEVDFVQTHHYNFKIED
jgi:hypothetical protein